MKVVVFVVFIVFLIVVIIAYAGGKLLGSKALTSLVISPSPSTLVSPLPSNSISPEATTSARVDSMNTPSAVVTAFADNLIEAMPPMGHTESASSAFNLLTDRAKEQINQKYSNNILEGLENFVGIQQAPNENLNLGKEVINANHAHLPLTWSYPDHSVVKTVYLVKDLGIWKIDMFE